MTSRMNMIGITVLVALHGCSSAGLFGEPRWQSVTSERAAVQVDLAKELGLHESNHKRYGNGEQTVERSQWGMRKGPHASFEIRTHEGADAAAARPPLTEELRAAWRSNPTFSTGVKGVGANRMGSYEFCRFNAAPNRSCVYIRQPATASATLRGWYCAAPNSTLSESAVRLFLDAYTYDLSAVGL